MVLWGLCAGLCLGSEQLPGNQQRLQEVSASSQEIIRHIIYWKTANCHFYTLVIIRIQIYSKFMFSYYAFIVFAFDLTS